MVQEPLSITVPPADSVSDLLDAADEQPVLIQRNGRRYRLDRLVEPSTEEIERSIAGTLVAAGSWRDLDAAAFKEYIAERRRLSRRPSVEI